MITKEQVIEALKTVKDPEIHVDVVSLGLVYNITVEKDEIKILITYTTPFCPWGPELNQKIIDAVKNSLGAKNVVVEVTFDPPYSMPADLRATLGI